MGPVVYRNAAGFIKFSRSDIINTGGEHNLLDTMRIHPEDYQFATKMARDAVDDEDARKKRKRRNDDDELDEQEALSELLQNPKYPSSPLIPFLITFLNSITYSLSPSFNTLSTSSYFQFHFPGYLLNDACIMSSLSI